MTPLTAALVISSRSLWEQTHACIQNLPVRIALEQNEPDDADALLDRIDRHRADVVLIEAHRLSMPIEEFIRRLRDTASQPAAFVLHPEASPQHILEALRAGAAEFLYPPLTDTLREAFEKLALQRAKTSAGLGGGLGRIYGFLSAKGGCGATTFAAHVAVETARRLGQPVLLADLDFESGMMRFLLKAKNSYSITDALANLHRMDSSYWKALISSLPNQLDLIPSPDDLAARRAADPHEMSHLMRFIRSVYPVTIVDFGRHISSSAFHSLPELEALYLVATGELDTLDRARDCVSAILARGLDASRLKVLLNRVRDGVTMDPQGVQSFLGMAAAASFSSDYSSL
ncbi:MAG TPA: hypothetical protein VNH18_07110, partial [Bryobacteraceae bacterium]|nr:hypothetical protein [Bryobacteraceae bacterium]